MKYRIMDYRFRLLASAAISCMVFFSCEEPEMPAAGQEGEKEEEVPDDGFTVPVVKPVIKYDRALWASINGRNDAADKEYASYNNTVLVSWRLYPGEEETAAFDIYRKAAGGEKVKLNDEPVTDATCWQDKSADLSVDNTYYLHMADDRYEVDSYTLKAERAASGLPYVSVFLKGTADVPGSATYSYDPNDISVGDLDGDGTTELVCNVLSDGSVSPRVCVYQRRSDGVYLGTLSPEGLAGFQDLGPDSCWSEFDPSERVFRLHYRVKGAEAFARTTYTGLEGLAFEKFPG